jgi:hypothetical protein
MQPKHDRKIVFSGVALTLGSMENDWKIWKILRPEFESFIIQAGYLENAPFLWIGIIFLYGLKNETKPRYKRIDKKDGELPLSIELDMRVLLTADETDPEMLKDFFEIATLDCLIHAGKKYKLKTSALEERRSQLGKIPDWEFDMEAHPEILKERYLATLPHRIKA